MIYPTLFIGLGTQGLYILEELQKLVLEEYGQKPPVFEYLYFETAKNNKPSVQSWATNEIRMPQPFPVIPDLSEKRQEYEDGRHNYLSPWLNEALLRFPEGNFTSGAGHIRMAGRLCLWMNWDSCIKAVNDARTMITGQESIDATNLSLREFYKRVGKQIKKGEQLVGGQPNVYIFGTLCGGTCGGMFIDVAYLIRKAFGLRGGRSAKLKGIFSVLDHSVLSNPSDDMEKSRAANCWASLVEMDYYSHRDTDYIATWPDGDKVNYSDPPFDYIYIISCSGNKSNLRLHGKPDIKALNHMAAMVLFSETVSDLLSKKEFILINHTSHKVYNTPYCEITQEKSSRRHLEDMPIFTTCGMAAVWYPKYRISEAAAFLVAMKIFKDWLGEISADTMQRIETQAKTDWEEILQDQLPNITYRPPGKGGPIEDEIKNWFKKEKEYHLKKSPSEILRILKKELEKFNEEKEIDKEISRPETLTEFSNKIKESLKNKVSGMVNFHNNLSYAEYYLTRLAYEVGETIKLMPKKYPKPEPKKLEGKIFVDIWAKLVFRHQAVARQKTSDMLRDAEDFFLKCLIEIRKYRIRPKLDSILEFLGENSDFTVKIKTLKQDLTDLRERLNQCIDEVMERGTRLSEEVTPPQNMKLIYANEINSQELDIRNLQERLYNHYEEHQRKILDRIMSEKNEDHFLIMPLTEFLRKGKDGINSSIINELRLRALELIGRFNIAEKLMEREDPESLRLFARRAEPYLELAGNIVPIDSPHFLMGHDGPGLNNLSRLSNEVLNDPTASNRIEFGIPEESPLIDHLLIFYKEKGLLFKNENFASAAHFQKWYSEVGKNAPYGLFTHKNGEYEFDPSRNKRLKKIDHLMAIVTQIFFQLDGSNDWKKSIVLEKAEHSGLTLSFFKLKRGKLVMEFKAKDGSDVMLLPNEKGMAFLARDSHAFELFQGEIAIIMKNIGDDGFIEQLNIFLAETESTLVNQGQTMEEIVDTIDEYRNQFLRWKKECAK